MLLSLHLPPPSPSSLSPSGNNLSLHKPYKPLYIKFRTSYRENLQYLKHLNIIPANTHPKNLPLPETVDHILATLNFLKSHSFSDSHIPRLAAATPTLFSTAVFPSDIAPVFHFLATDVAASTSESRSLVHFCPHLLLSDADHFLRPTHRFLKNEIGLTGLNRPTNRNAHLLNARVETLRVKVRFLVDEVGFEYEEAVRALARLPAIFGYGLESNLRPKFEYLVREMGREVAELKDFPQYFGFSLEKRIMPRHLHLKEKGIVGIPLNKMLMWGDERFYSKWK